MGQLIKLQDYISRYEVDMFRYPGQFIRLKKQQWGKTKDKGTDALDERKQQFLDHIFEFQLKWASSTIREKSYVDREFYHDPNLKYFLQRFPDTNLVLYRPIFKLKNAPVEVEIIIISPTTTWLITILEGEENSVFLGSNERFWTEKRGHHDKKVLSPMIELDRMDGIVRTIYSLYRIELPIRKVILNRTGYFDFPLVPYDIELVEKRNYDEWFTSLRKMSSPLKHMQLKAGNALLQYCQTVCVRRMD
ncbi:NERD domain-containing protein [Bacillus timonensis]|uniref:NERD domain-containing protein n=1 Tax=Bacillus timonensis TaxID=1033734 RepID=A0A4S3PYV5_9BACI|nr:NERD domain-containing protein [Bacillus timonensis]THE14805.1 NERD domain-containing protein [Bacillus timonensis]